MTITIATTTGRRHRGATMVEIAMIMGLGGMTATGYAAVVDHVSTAAVTTVQCGLATTTPASTRAPHPTTCTPAGLMSTVEQAAPR
jgi:hypothetical protein